MLSFLFVATAIFILLAILQIHKGTFARTIIRVVFLVNIISLILYYVSHRFTSVFITISTRELVIYAYFIVILVLVKKSVIPVQHLIDKVYLSLLIFFSIHIFLLSPDIVNASLSGRELVFPLLVYFVFRWLQLNPQNTLSLVKVTVHLAVATAVLAILEWIYINQINPNFWADIQINGYLAQKYGEFTEAYPKSWINYLPVYWNSQPIFRSIGLMLNPLATGHFIACGFVLALAYYRNETRLFFLSAIGIATLCIASKATVLICFMAIGFLSVRVKSKMVRVFALATLFALVSGIGVWMLSTFDGNFTHANAFLFGAQSILDKPFGHGVGTTGHFTKLVSGEGNVAGDTTFSVYAYQMGIPGMFALILIVILPFIILLRRLWSFRNNPHIETPLVYATMSLFGAYAILAFASAAAFTAVPIFIPMMMLGIYVSRVTSINYNHRQNVRYHSLMQTANT